MKKLLIAAAGLVVLVVPAMAADMAPVPVYTKAPPIVAPVYNWTGFYIGIEGGGDWGSAKAFHGSNDPTHPGAYNTDITDWFHISSGLVGLTAGYNYQVNKFVFGVEGDMSWTNGSGSAFDIPPFSPLFNNGVDQHWLATVRGRVGYLVVPSVLLYGTGGFVASDVSQIVSVPSTVLASIAESQTMTGWTIGAGAEWKFARQWSVKAEYLYVDLGEKSYFNPHPVTVANYLDDQRVLLRNNIFRVGLNYTFGGPVVAKY